MADLERAVKRLELVRDGLETETIDLKSALEITITHLLEVCEIIQEQKA